MCTLNGIFDKKVKKSKAELPHGKEDVWKCPITETQVPMKRCIDNTLTWAGSFENAARQVWSILYWGAKSGIVFNLDKLVIAEFIETCHIVIKCNCPTRSKFLSDFNMINQVIEEGMGAKEGWTEEAMEHADKEIETLAFRFTSRPVPGPHRPTEKPE